MEQKLCVITSIFYLVNEGRQINKLENHWYIIVCYYYYMQVSIPTKMNNESIEITSTLR